MHSIYKHLIYKFNMKKILLLIVLAISAVSMKAQDRAFGADLNLGFGTPVGFGIGAKYHHGFNDDWRVTGDVKYLFANMNVLELDANANYLFDLGSSDAKIYPLAGIGLWSWFGEGGGAHMLFNLGVGVDYPLGDNWYANAEFAFKFWDGSRENLSVGLMYKF